MSEANPYAAPAAPVEQQQAREAGVTGRIGVPSGVELPLVCAICGEVAGTTRVRKSFRIPRPLLTMLYLGIFLLLAFYRGWPISLLSPTVRGLIIATMFLLNYTTGPSRTHAIPLCHSHKQRWVWATILRYVERTMFLLIVAAPVGFLPMPFFLGWLGLLILGPSLTRKWILQVILVANEDKKTFDQERLWLTGVHEHAREVYIHAGQGRVRG